MFVKGKRSLRKNMAIFMCVALVFLLLPNITHAASKSSFSVSLNAYAFYIANLTVNIVVHGSTSPSDDPIFIQGALKSKKKPKDDD